VAGCEPEMLKIFFDGGCRPNPGTMETAVVARGQTYHQRDLGHGSAEQAEWLALLHALRVARSLGAVEVLLVGDSLSVINQANGRSRSRRPELHRSRAAFEDQAGEFSKLRIRHISRTQKLAGIALAKPLTGP
jgi:ribonuclease HI